MQNSTSTIMDMREVSGACPWRSTPTCATFHWGPCPERNKVRIDLHIHGSRQWDNEGLEEQLSDMIEHTVRREE